MPAWELITARATAIGATLAAMTVNTGNSFTIRNTDEQTDIRLAQLWADVQVAGTVRLRSPRMHDNVQGIRIPTVVSELKALLPPRTWERLFTQDTLTLELAGSAVAGDIETVAMLIWYADLPGINGRFLMPEEVMQRMVHVVTVENTLSLGTTGDYTGEEAINAEFDLLRANTDYALVGYQVSAECLAVRWRGVDVGNLGVGGPGLDDGQNITRNWFSQLSLDTGVAAIPVFNSANKPGILLDGVQDENGADVTVASILVQLEM